jgi:phage terminase small subunit
VNRRQERFAVEYAATLNGTQAALEAGYSTGWAYKAAQLLLQNPQVVLAVERAHRERLERSRLKGDDLLEHLRRLAYSDIRNVLTWKAGKLTIKDSDSLSPEVATTIRKVRLKADGEIEVELEAKAPAMKLLMDHLGLTPRARTANGGPVFQQQNNTFIGTPTGWKTFAEKVESKDLLRILGLPADYLEVGPPPPPVTDGED